MASPLKPETVLNLQTVQTAVVEHLRNMILKHELLPGQRLIQDELAQQLGVSRTPIREALNRLAHEGFVEISSYKGASVAKFSITQLEDIYTVRVALESYATCLAARNITPQEVDTLTILMNSMQEAFLQKNPERLLIVHNQFHAGIYAAAHKHRLYELSLQNLELSMVYQRLAFSMGRGSKDPVIEHQDLLKTIQRHDSVTAGEMMLNHLEFTLAELLALFQNSPLSPFPQQGAEIK